MKKITITGDLAHFKVPSSSKIQRTFKIPPISTVVGILQNIFNKDINNFSLGYFIEYEQLSKELIIISKEVNINVKKLSDGDRFIKDTITVENLYNVRLVIYTDIEDDIELLSPLTLGKANYLGKLEIEDVTISMSQGTISNQYLPIELGDGKILRVNTITKYNSSKGYYDYKSCMLRETLSPVEVVGSCDDSEDRNIFFWKWEDGEVNAY